MTQPLARTVVRGAFWTYSTSLVVLGAQVLYTGVTSRLVPPAGFGAYATAQALASFVAYFTFSSLGSAVTRQIRQTEADRWAAVGIAVGGGALGTIALWVLAPQWARLWSSPGSVDVIRALSLTIATSPLGAVCVGLLRRDLRLRTAAIVECGGALLGMVGGLILVIRMHSPVALALGLGIGALATVVLALASGSANELGRPTVSWTACRALLSFSGQVSGQNLVYYGVNTAPTWLVSRIGGSALLGLYSRANLLVGLPLTQLAAGSTKALYPAYAKLQDDTTRLRPAITDGLVAVSGVAFCLFAGIAGCAPVLIPLLLGPRWYSVTSLLPIFAIGAAINIVFVVLANAFEARAMLRASWWIQGVLVATIVPGLFVASRTREVMSSAALVLALAYAAAHFCQILVARRQGIIDVAPLMRAYVIHGLIGLAMFLALWTVGDTLLPVGVAVATVATLLTGAACCCLLWIMRRSLPAYRCAAARGLLGVARTPEPVAS